jgi:hypothetical protein
MAEIVGGLFGVSPEQLMRQRQTTDASNAFRFAQLSPMERAQYSIYQGGAGVGRAVGGLLGGDPELEKISKIKQLSSQFDLTTPQGARQFAQALQPFAPQEAMMAAREADRMEQAGLGREKTAAETTLAEAKTQAALRERRTPTSGLGKLIVERDELLNNGIPANDPRIVAYNRAINAEGEGKGTKVEVNLGGVFDKAFAKQEAEKQADDWTKAGQAYSDASALARNVREMESVVGSAFVGSYGSLQAGVSRAFGGGKRLNDTEVFDALSAQLVLPLAKLLPGSLAVKELDQLIKTKPNLKQQEGTIRRLLNTINQDLRASEISYEAGEKYRSQNDGKISGFNPYIAKNKASRFTELEGIYKSGKKLTDAQKAEAQKLAKELQLEGL